MVETAQIGSGISILPDVAGQQQPYQGAYANSQQMGGAIGTGLAGLSDSLQKIATSFKNDQDKLDGFNLQKSYLEFQSQEAQSFAEAQRTVSGGAKDFTKTYLTGAAPPPTPGGTTTTASSTDDNSDDSEDPKPTGGFDARAAKWLDDNLSDATPDVKAQWAAKLAGLRSTQAAAALRTEFQERDRYYQSSVGTSLNTLATGIDQSPGALAAYKTQGDQIIDASGLSAADKQAQHDWWTNNSAMAYGVAKTRADPQAMATELGSDSVGYYAKLKQQENNTGDPNAKNPLSSASGNYQFTDGTWAQVANTPEGNAAGLTIAGKNDPTQQEAGIRILTKQNATALTSAGFEPNEKNLYLAHFMGAGGATDFLKQMKADPTANAAEAFPEAASANPSIFFNKGGEQGPQGSRTLAQVYAIQTQKFGPGAPPMTVDPNLAPLTYQQRASLRDTAERETVQQQNFAQTQQTQQYDTWFNSFQTALHDGTMGQADINNARVNGNLTKYGDITTAENIVKARNADQADIATFNAKTADPNAAWNPMSSDDKRVANAGVKALGNTPEAGLSVYSRTGIVPDATATMLRGALVSTNPQQVESAANIAANMMTRNPNVFAGVPGQSSLENAGSMYSHFTNDLGMSGQDAAKKIADMNSPDYQAKVKVRNDDVKAFQQDLASPTKSDALAVLQKALIPRSGPLNMWSGPNINAMQPEQKGAMLLDYAELASDHFAQYGDKDAAKAYATAQMSKMYGVSNGALMKFPPEKAYPPVNGSTSYVYDQAAAAVKDRTGIDVAAKDVFLVPLPGGLTSEAFKAGRPPPYAVGYTHPVNGVPTPDILLGSNGKRAGFVADPAPLIAAQHAAAQEGALHADNIRQGVNAIIPTLPQGGIGAAMMNPRGAQ